MINYLKANYLSLLIIAYLVFAGGGAGMFGAYDSTTNTNPQIFEDTVDVDGDLSVDTNLLYVDVSADRVGIGSTTPAATLGINSGTATSTVYFGSNACFAFQTMGSGSDWLYYFPATSTSNADVTGWAT